MIDVSPTASVSSVIRARGGMTSPGPGGTHLFRDLPRSPENTAAAIFSEDTPSARRFRPGNSERMCALTASGVAESERLGSLLSALGSVRVGVRVRFRGAWKRRGVILRGAGCEGEVTLDQRARRSWPRSS